MIKEIFKDDINVLNSSILKKETVLNDLNCNVFGHYLVYIENNCIIGFLYYSNIYERAEINQIEVGFIHRNCGIGSKLLEKMIECVDKDITLEVRKDNFPAIHLYEKYNFKRIGIRKGYYNGVDAILMERKISK